MRIFLMIMIASLSFAEDPMLDRMQSVVDEVSELRQKYEECSSTNVQYARELQNRDDVISKLSKKEGVDYRVFEENRKKVSQLEKENVKLAKKVNALRANYDEQVDVNKALKKENKKLRNQPAEVVVKRDEESITVLKEEVKELQRSKATLERKNETLVAQQGTKSSKVEKELREIITGLEEEVARLKKEKASVQKKSVVKERVVIKEKCEGEVPFPKLMKAQKVRAQAAATYRIKGDSSIYCAVDGKVVAIWEDTTSFTGREMRDGWVRITGYFVDKTWQPAKETLFVSKENTIKR